MDRMDVPDGPDGPCGVTVSGDTVLTPGEIRGVLDRMHRARRQRVFRERRKALRIVHSSDIAFEQELEDLVFSSDGMKLD